LLDGAPAFDAKGFGNGLLEGGGDVGLILVGFWAVVKGIERKSF
jgi:hypothetical protein